MSHSEIHAHQLDLSGDATEVSSNVSTMVVKLLGSITDHYPQKWVKVTILRDVMIAMIGAIAHETSYEEARKVVDLLVEFMDTFKYQLDADFSALREGESHDDHIKRLADAVPPDVADAYNKRVQDFMQSMVDKYDPETEDQPAA